MTKKGADLTTFGQEKKGADLTKKGADLTNSLQHPPYRKSALRPSKWPPNDPKFRDFSYFYMTYLKSKKKFFGFSQ